MAEPIVKVCGISTISTLEASIASGADMIGLVQFPPSPRHISLETAATLSGKTCGRADIVALTVDPDDALVDRIAADLKPDWIQLHGQETPERIKDIKARGKSRVIKALGIRTAQDVEAVAAYQDVADLFILDAKPPKDATRPGGLGEAFDWTLLEGLPGSIRYLLAGGLTADTVGKALRSTRANGVDASSSLETAPGTKDEELIRAFVTNAKEARQEA